MSKCVTITFMCEECHKKYDATVCDTINVTLNPELREKFLSGELYSFKCPHCGHVHYIIYPILYQDTGHNFMVQTGSLMDIYDFWKMAKSKGILSNTTITGATTLKMAREKIAALENGLDHKLATIYCCAVRDLYNIFADDYDKERASDSYLYYDNDGNLSVILDCLEMDTQKPYSVYQTFDRIIYNSTADLSEKYLKGSCDFLFNDFSAERIMTTNDEFYKNSNSVKLKLALIYEQNGNSYFAKLPDISRERFNIGDTVILTNDNWQIFKGKIFDLTNDITEYEFPFDLDQEKILTVMRKTNNKALSKSCDYDEELDNRELLEALIKFDKKETKLPYEIIKESDVALGVKAYADDQISVGDKIENISSNELKDYKPGNVIKSNDAKERFVTNMVKKYYDEEPYLCVYLNQKDVPEEDNGCAVSKAIFNLDEVIDYVIGVPEKFKGILIISGDKKISIDTWYLGFYYIEERVMTNDKRVIQLLDSLTDSEKEFIGAKRLEYLKLVYFDEKNPKQIAKEKQVSLKYVGETLTEAYEKLRYIVKFCR